MQAVRRLAGGDPGIIADAGLGIVAAGLTAVAAWGPSGLIGTAIAGPSWLLALLPLLMGVPLVLRRRAPLLMWIAIWAGIVLQSPFTLDRAHVLRYGPDPRTPVPFTFVLFAAAYSLGAHASLRRAAAGLVLAAPVVAEISHHGGMGLAFHSDGGSADVTLSMLQLAAFWLAGVLVRARRQTVAMAARSAALQRQAEQAAAAERARIARELHDIIAHHLSVVVLHAAGARASGGADPATLEEIEHSGRQALTETRRLFGVLREPGEETGRAPQPGLGELPALVGRLRAAGLEVSLSVDGDHTALPSAVNVSAYRIVQEALTNVLKHAGTARAEVTVGCADSAVTIEVTDDGPGNPAPPAVKGGGPGGTGGGSPPCAEKAGGGSARALGVIHLKDIVKEGIAERFAEMRAMGIRTVMITGDNPLTAKAIADESGVDDFLAEATPEDKMALIKKEQQGGKLVAMTGDGTNDAPALAQADVGVAMNTGTSAAKDAGNMVDLDSNPTKLIEIVEIGKQLLITRGALTTFSITNDVAKYFAIIPAMFSAVIPGLAKLNILHLYSPKSAITSAIIFNALIIVALIPLALRGVRYRPASSQSMLRRNLVIYGIGGLIIPFVGIWAIDLIVQLIPGFGR